MFGGLCYVVAVMVALAFQPHISIFDLCLIGLVSAIIPIMFCEVVFLKVHKRPRVGLVQKSKPDRQRLSIKLLGYYTSLALVFSLYLFFPVYEEKFFFNANMIMLVSLLVFIVVGWIYISEFDPRMKDPYDDPYWHFGNFVCGRWKDADSGKIGAHLKSLALRAFFLPTMLAYFSVCTSLFINGHDDYVHSLLPGLDNLPGSFILKFILMTYFLLMTIDVLFAAIGYLMTFKVLDTDIRTTDSTFMGWAVCILCYSPFWEAIFITYLFNDLYYNPPWHTWMASSPWFIPVWGSLVIIFQALESLTTLSFGFRFSNLTWRGLMATGLFRFTKHPQYVSKTLNRFFYYVPFLSTAGLAGALTNTAMFAGVCFIYFLRARTEENHLTRYPEYVEYAQWIDENGIFRGAGKIFPFLKYSEARSLKGKIF